MARVYQASVDPPAPDRWTVVGIDLYAGVVSFATLKADGSYQRWRATPDRQAGTFTLRTRLRPEVAFAFAFKQPDDDHLILDGSFEGHPMHAMLERLKSPHFLLRERGFHWVNEIPYNY
jgi:hypothetical protein